MLLLINLKSFSWRNAGQIVFVIAFTVSWWTLKVWNEHVFRYIIQIIKTPPWIKTATTSEQCAFSSRICLLDALSSTMSRYASFDAQLERGQRELQWANSKKYEHDFHKWSLAENHMLTKVYEYELALSYHLSKQRSDDLQSYSSR